MDCHYIFDFFDFNPNIYFMDILINYSIFSSKFPFYMI